MICNESKNLRQYLDGFLNSQAKPEFANSTMNLTDQRNFDVAIYWDTPIQFEKLVGFRKYHTIPENSAEKAFEFINQIAEREIDNDLKLIYEKLRSAFGLKRREIEVTGPNGSGGAIATPDFNYEIYVDASADAASRYVFRRELNSFRDLNGMITNNFGDIFGHANWRLRQSFSQAVDVSDIVDQVEDRNDPELTVDYDKDLHWCEITIRKIPGKLRVTASGCFVEPKTASRPESLINTLLEFQSRLKPFGDRGSDAAESI